MVEFDVDMAYLEDAGELDEVVLLDENGELSGITYVPETSISDLEDENEALRNLAEGLRSMLPSVPELCHNCAFVAECHSQSRDGRCWLDDYMTELGV